MRLSRTMIFLLALSGLIVIGFYGCATSKQAEEISAEVKRIEQKLDSILEKPEPVTKDTAVAIAIKFADLKKVISIRQPRVVSKHTETFNVMGNDGKGDILIGVDPNTGEVIKMVKQCPYPGRDGEKVVISGEEAISKAQEFLSKHRLPPIPEGFVMEKPKLKTTWNKRHWEIVWRHYVGDVEVLSDFVSIIVNAENGEIASYSKVRHDVEVSRQPKLSADEAIKWARGVLGKGMLQHYSPDLNVLKTILKIVYPNHYFEKWRPQWSENQTLAWIVQFGTEGRPAIDIWIDATTGELLGGEIYERPVPELWGCLDQRNDITGYPGWEAAMDLMQYDTTHTFLHANNCPEANVINSIQNGTYFVFQSHGDIDAQGREHSCLTWSCSRNVDADVLTPDEIPNNNLRYALLSHCMGGHDGPGDDFKDVFIDQGADVFHGYDGYINPDDYESSLLRYLAQGQSLWNAHWNAVADENPTFTIVIEFGPPLYCYNQLRLAPLLVDVTAPSTTWRNVTITATVRNREDARHTTATNVRARLELPSGFTILSGANPQVASAIAWNHSWTAQWKAHAPIWTMGTRTFDVVVWSDNLGVEVDDFDNPYHRVDVNFMFPFIAVIKDYLELVKWWELAERIFETFLEPRQIMSLSKELDRYKSVDDVQKDPRPFLTIVTKMAELELQFGNHFIEPEKKIREPVRRYLKTIETKMAYLKKLQGGEFDAKEVLTKLSVMQMRINEAALNAFWKK